ncbi:Glyco_transf_90 domain-containing protein [Cephalotus follicularis]|uniref:Glyco_transf_90 domain-containing protein n=1 Tax=Cephalotus follicularis TaxID=3775 RepID=A0A1Q3C8D8_CEPFO|nr:Glyco_transf_90 domain-containing protein [Cephalotus follicularis]
MERINDLLNHLNNSWHESVLHSRCFIGTHWEKRPSATTIGVFFVFLFFGALVFVRWNDASIFSYLSSERSTYKTPSKQEFPLKCTNTNLTQTCPKDYPTKHNPTYPSNVTCPSYFRWIHEDLRPWNSTGITRDMIEQARRTAHFRLVIVNGKAYVEKYRKAMGTRDMFTLWGILQLLRWYPENLPDLELMFDCDDSPVVPSRDFPGPNTGPPPLFRYSADEFNLDIVFPDWSFWGWAEINIKPWEHVLEDIIEGNKRIKWKDRVPYAYWKGNPYVAPTRKDLMKCNVSDKSDWNTLLYIQDWDRESKQGYKQSNLADQCNHRYKIYIEGWAWSVSEKYILACDSMTLFIKSHFYDFFIRGMEPLQHYWPIRDNSKCSSLKFAVEWGNNHTEKAQAIGKAGSNFIQEDLKMGYVYDYMFHLLNEYAKLLKFKPSIPPGSVELCSEIMACPVNDTTKHFMVESLVMSPSDTLPCIMPLPYDPLDLKDYYERRTNSTMLVEMWENEYWGNINKK